MQALNAKKGATAQSPNHAPMKSNPAQTAALDNGALLRDIGCKNAPTFRSKTVQLGASSAERMQGALMSCRWSVPLVILAATVIGACAPMPNAAPTAAAPAPADPVAIRFAMQAGDEAVSCAQGATSLGTAQNAVTFNDLRFYVSNVALVNAEGDTAPVELLEDGLWQSGVHGAA